MSMLILETFLLMLLSGLLGTALGSLLAEAWGSDAVSSRPWLRDRSAHPPQPVLPTAPEVMSDAERARLLAALSAPPPTPRAAVAASAPPPVAPADTTAATTATASTAAVEPPSAAPEAPPAVPAAAEAPAIAEADAGRAAEADAHGDRPAGLLAPRTEKADDLKRIKGIGKQNEARLNALGIWHFDQIAAWTPENIRWAGSFLAFHGRIEREDWVGQAKVLAAGGITEFAGRVDAGAVPTSSS